MVDFVTFLLTKVYQPISISEDIINKAFERMVKDVNYHFPMRSADDIIQSVQSNQNELAMFLFRLGQELRLANQPTHHIHWLMKELCALEIYFNNQIDEGFYVIHGEGTVIGSRNTIGKGFKIHQGCTIGHKVNGRGDGNRIGNDVTMYANASIIGSLSIGNNAVIGAHALVLENIPENSKVISTAKTRIL
jgi:serine O-acetyltransferase